jgi:branched-chain amino acid aminotransferase
MEIVSDIQSKKTTASRLKEVDWKHLEFGKIISDHMLVCVYENGEWGQSQILPYGDLQLSPATLALHYGQSIFEGMKAFYTANDSINIFRIEQHHKRLNRSLQRMCMPEVPKDLFIDGLHQLINLDRHWVPKEDGSSLYIRPFVFASEARFGVKVSDKYHFIVFSGPVPPLYQKPIKVKVEREYIRAAKGGTGFAKCAGNYGGAFYPTQLAREEGYDQVLWTDAKENEFIEESGTMNVMFVINGKLVTPPLSDSILDGITRDSLLDIAKHLGIPVQERPIGATELKYAFKNQTITEAFGAGTAAIVAPISVIGIDGEDYELPAYNDNAVMFQLKNELDAIRYGKKEDSFNWNYLI